MTDDSKPRHRRIADLVIEEADLDEARVAKNRAREAAILDRVLIAGLESLGYDVDSPEETLAWLKSRPAFEPLEPRVAAEARRAQAIHELCLMDFGDD